MERLSRHGPADRAALAAWFRAVRAETERLCAPLAPEDYQLQSMPECSPLKWHLFHPQFSYLFNSYDDAVGPRWPSPEVRRLEMEAKGTVCAWAAGDTLLRTYHDEEWGVPEWDSRALWEKLVLDGFQAGLSWLIILKKRDAFRAAFKNFDPEVVARFGKADVNRLLKNDGIIRSRLKVEAAVESARAYLAMRERGEDFSTVLWGLAGNEPVVNRWTAMTEVPTKSATSELISKELKARGFKFAGPVIVYAWMQAVGMVNDHLVGCERHAAVRR